MTRLRAAAPPATATALTGRLGVTAIVFMVVAAAAPLTVIGGVVPLGFLLGNGVGFPSMFVIAAVVLLVFSVGLSAMTRHVPRPGAFFTFVGYGLGRTAGVAAAFLALLTYTAVQLAIYGYIGYALSVGIVALGGPNIAWYAYSLLTLVIVGLLGYRHIDLSSRVLGVLLVAEIGIVLVLVASVVITGGADGISAAPFDLGNVVSGAPGVGLTFAVAAFIGFEATAIFRDEAKDPGRTIPRATIVAVVGIGVFYAVSSWGVVMAWGPDFVVAAAAEDPGSMIIVTALNYLGPVGETVINVLLITSLLAAALSFHNVLTRYQHSMASGGVLAPSLARVHERHHSPYISSVVQSVTAAVLITVCAIAGLDPVVQIFGWFAGLSTVGVAILMALTSLAILVYFSRTATQEGAWRTRIAPTIGLIGLIGATILILGNFPLLVGDVDATGAPTFGIVSTLLLGSVIVLSGIGILRALALRSRSPETYAALTETISS